MGKYLLEKLKTRKNIYGTCISSVAPLWGNAARNAGLDFVFLDTEHIPLERMEVAHLCQLYRAMKIAPIVRIPSPDSFAACQMIDAGAEGVLAPYVEDVEQIRDMVGALKYRPLKGERVKKAVEDPDSLDPDLARYLQNNNKGNICLINIESRPSIESLDELLSVPGVDAVFIGPHDLSVSLDLPEKYDHPEFEAAVRQIIQKCRKNDVSVGIHFSESPDRQIKWVKEGANIIIHSSDMAIFSQQLQKDMNQIRGESGDLLVESGTEIIV